MFALEALAPVVIALMCLLLYLSFRSMIKAVATALPNWHIPGFSSLRDWVMGFVDSAYDIVKQWTEPQLHAVAHVVSYPVNFFRKLYRTASSLWHITAVTLAYIVGTKIPAILHAALNYAHRLYELALAYVVAKVSALAAVVESRYRAAINYAHRLYDLTVSYVIAKVSALAHVVELRYQQAVNYAHRLYNLALAYVIAKVSALAVVVEARFHTAIAYIDARVHSLAVHVEQLYDNALRYADAAARAAATALLGTLNGAASIAIAQIWPILVTDIDKLAATAAGEFTDVVADLRSATRAIPRDLVGAIALAPAIAVPLIRMMERCVIPNCRNLSQFGRELQDIFALVGGFELAELIAEMARNPNGAADEINRLLVDPLQGIAHGVESLIGV